MCIGQSVRVSVVEVDVGEGGRAYIRARLEGGLSLSSVVLRSVDLERGSVVALVSDSHPDPLAFAVGGGDRWHACDALRVTVRALFDGGPSASLWVEEPLPRRSDFGDKAPDTGGCRPWFLCDEVYTLVFAADDDSRLRDAFDKIYDYPGWGGGGVVSTDASSLSYRDSYELGEEGVAHAASAIQAIVCGAYDGQGFLIWTPD